MEFRKLKESQLNDQKEVEILSSMPHTELRLAPLKAHKTYGPTLGVPDGVDPGEESELSITVNPLKKNQQKTFCFNSLVNKNKNKQTNS